MDKETFNLRSSFSDNRGKEIFELTPILLGGSPTDPANKVLLNRGDHVKAVVYWNRILYELRQQSREARAAS
jgi:hypothetical protein